MKTATEKTFTGFTPESLRFFRRLARNNHKPWLDKNRALYEAHIKGGLKTLFEALTPFMLDLDPDFEVSGKTGKNFSRINRDIRFAKDKTPYYTRMYVYFKHRKQAGAQLYVGLAEKVVTCGLSIYRKENGTLDSLLKPRRAKDPRKIEKVFRALGRRYEIYWYGTEKKEWKKCSGFPQTGEDWQRCQGLVVRKMFPHSRKELQSSRFLHTVEKNFTSLFPLYAFSTIEGRRGERALASVR